MMVQVPALTPLTLLVFGILSPNGWGFSPVRPKVVRKGKSHTQLEATSKKIREALPAFLGFPNPPWRGVYPGKAPNEVELFQLCAVHKSWTGKTKARFSSKNLADMILKEAPEEVKNLEDLKDVKTEGYNLCRLSKFNDKKFKAGTNAIVKQVDIGVSGRKQKATDFAGIIARREKMKSDTFTSLLLDVLKNNEKDIKEKLFDVDKEVKKVAVVVGIARGDLQALTSGNSTLYVGVDVPQVPAGIGVGGGGISSENAIVKDKVLLVELTSWDYGKNERISTGRISVKKMSSESPVVGSGELLDDGLDELDFSALD